ncbi:hypothetical protein Egran_06057 [Elaphomyces granulatus]|uniref:AB hydrolase-1 domain-containing protein n=1 Tax=Elaphomyces granulatus TaxID=519963 RepID=A0A232LPV9_9EURO|nr:hypothetical protein Egran_06057 [Elaphomyces granulatus]
MGPTNELGLPSISRKSYTIAGIAVTVFGLDELTFDAAEIACLWLLHPRLATQESMFGVADTILNDWNKSKRPSLEDVKLVTMGLIAVTFDQRNHGTREIDPLVNKSWKQGNPRHAQDLFSIFQGTARDVSLLIDCIPAYIFPTPEKTVTEHIVLGVSLGGHAAWSCLFHEPRITCGVVIIGCPDYVNLMADRARLSKLPSWVNGDPPGSQFLGSEDFPLPLLEAVRKYDPAGLLLSQIDIHSIDHHQPLRENPLPDPPEIDKQILLPLMKRCLSGKRILILSGGVDKLVPYHRGEPLLTWLKKAIAPNGWFADGRIHLEDIIFEKAGHEMTSAMIEEASRFVGDYLSEDPASTSSLVREAKI